MAASTLQGITQLGRLPHCSLRSDKEKLIYLRVSKLIKKKGNFLHKQLDHVTIDSRDSKHTKIIKNNKKKRIASEKSFYFTRDEGRRGTSIDFTEILGTFGFFPENKFFGHPYYEKYNIYPQNGDCDPKKQFFGTLEQVFEKSQKVWTVVPEGGENKGCIRRAHKNYK